MSQDQFRSVSITNSTQIKAIVSELNRHPQVFARLEASCFSAADNYIKWFSPSLDFPCIPNSYYLFAPFTIEWKNNLGVIIPHFVSAEEKGERRDVLEIVKDSITRIIVHLPQKGSLV